MQELIALESIREYETDQDALAKRFRAYFKNGLMLSTISGPMSYGGTQGLFEIAIIDPSTGDYLTDAVLGNGDDVKGFLTKEQVLEIAHKVAAYA